MDSSVFEQASTIKSWDDDYYHPIARRFYDRAVSDMLTLMAIPKGANVLDAGSGPGAHAIRVARAGYQVTAIDISLLMLRTAQDRAAKAGLLHEIKFQQEDLTRLSFPDASFRHIFSWGVIIHIQDIDRALDELARILMQGGPPVRHPRGCRAIYPKATEGRTADRGVEHCDRGADPGRRKQRRTDDARAHRHHEGLEPERRTNV
jgi:2-polyprenyl-3-methyl-5-hydroxy-6-metoxy-1,4-benzoquinol methylase